MKSLRRELAYVTVLANLTGQWWTLKNGEFPVIIVNEPVARLLRNIFGILDRLPYHFVIKRSSGHAALISSSVRIVQPLTPSMRFKLTLRFNGIYLLV